MHFSTYIFQVCARLFSRPTFVIISIHFFPPNFCYDFHALSHQKTNRWFPPPPWVDLFFGASTAKLINFWCPTRCVRAFFPDQLLLLFQYTFARPAFVMIWIHLSPKQIAGFPRPWLDLFFFWASNAKLVNFLVPHYIKVIPSPGLTFFCWASNAKLVNFLVPHYVKVIPLPPLPPHPWLDL